MGLVYSDAAAPGTRHRMIWIGTSGYNLRDEGYQADAIKRWADAIARDTASCREVFVYFKHEEEGKGPEFAKLLMERLGRSSSG